MYETHDLQNCTSLTIYTTYVYYWQITAYIAGISLSLSLSLFLSLSLSLQIDRNPSMAPVCEAARLL